MNEADRERLGLLLVQWRQGDLDEQETEELLRRIGTPEGQDLLLEECLLTGSILEFLQEARAVRRRERPRPRRPLLLPAAAAAGILLALAAAALLRKPSEGPWPAAIVRDARGEVTLVGTGRRIPARPETVIPEGGGLETSPGASAAVIFADGTRLDLRASTAVGRVRSGPPKRLRLARGEIEARVAPQPSGREMEIETPHASVRVIGTLLRLRVSAAVSRLEVVEGAASMTRRTDGKSVEVPAGTFAMAAEGTDLSARPLTAGAWGISLGSWGDRDFARVFALLREAGIPGVRVFPGWTSIGPGKGQGDGSASDVLLRNAREQGIEVSGLLGGPGSPRDPQVWRDFVRTVVTRSSPVIRFWEVHNGSLSDGPSREVAAKNYAEWVRLAREAAREADPGSQIGIDGPEADLAFLEQAIRSGVGGQFDFVAIRPYALMETLEAGREPVFLRLATNLRRMLARTGQRPDLPLWVGEAGLANHPHPRGEQQRADVLVKTFVLSRAQGFERVFWLENPGGSRDAEGGRGPVFGALRTMTSLLGSDPEYLGWFSPEGRNYGFVFLGPDGPVLVAWAAVDGGVPLRWEAPVRVSDLRGRNFELKAGQELFLTRSPVFVTELPPGLAALARAVRERPFPWARDFSRAESVAWRPEAPAAGLEWFEREDGRGAAGIVEGVPARRTDLAGGRPYLYFDVDDSYVSIDDPDLEISITARRADPSRNAGCNLLYESTRGYRLTDEWWTVPPSPGWHTHVFRLRDAYFANGWGYNFRISALGSEGDLWVREVAVRRASRR